MPNQVRIPSLSEPFMNRKDFDEYQGCRIEKEEFNRAYSEYVHKFKKNQNFEFYRDHKHHPWFIEKYDPSEIFKWNSYRVKYA